MKETQTIKIKQEAFDQYYTKYNNHFRNSRYIYGETKSFNYYRYKYFRNVLYSNKFRNFRSIKDTINFLEIKCFELVSSIIIDNLSIVNLNAPNVLMDIIINKKSIDFVIDTSKDPLTP